MIPGNEPAGDGRFVGITTVTGAAVAGAGARDRPRRHGRRHRARHDDRPVPARPRGERRAEVGRARARPTRSWPRASMRAFPPRSSATAPSCRSSTTWCEREVFVPPTRRGVDPPARAVPFPRRCRSRSLPRRGGSARLSVAEARRPGRAAVAVGDRPLAGITGARLHRVLGRARSRRRGSRRWAPTSSRSSRSSGPTASASAPPAAPLRPGVLRDVGGVPRRRTSASAGSHSISAIPTASRSRATRGAPTWSSRTSRRGCSSSSVSTTKRCARSGPTS